MPFPSQIGGLSRSIVPITLSAAFAMSGCQRYERAPLDLAAHRQEILGRTLDASSLSGFADEFKRSPDHSTFSLTDGVSLAEAQAVALVWNGHLRTQRARARVSSASAENAGLWEDPTLGVDLTRIIESVEHPWKIAATIGLTIPISGRLEVEKRLAGDQNAVELAQIVQAEWQVTTDLNRAWARWESLTTQARVTREFLGPAMQILSVVDAMETAGELSRTEARLFRIENTTRRGELLRLDAAITQVELEIRGLMGIAPTAPISILPSAISIPPLTRDLAALSLDHHPAMLVAAARYQAAERSLELEIRKQIPDFSLSPGYGREDGDDEFLLGFSIPLPIWNANRRAIAEARASRDLSREEVHETQESLLRSIASACAELDSARLRREWIERELIPLVDAQDADARKLAQLGEVNTIILLESLVRRLEAKVQFIESTREEALASIRVLELLGPALQPIAQNQAPAASAPLGEVHP